MVFGIHLRRRADAAPTPPPATACADRTIEVQEPTYRAVITDDYLARLQRNADAAQADADAAAAYAKAYAAGRAVGRAEGRKEAGAQ